MNKYTNHSKRAQKAAKRLKMCESKRAYATQEEAAAHKGQRVYRCPFCQLWHRSGSLTTLINVIAKRTKKQ